MPKGRILTEGYRSTKTAHLCASRQVPFAAAMMAEPSSTDHAFEVRGRGYVNNTSHIENAETSAIGEALANLRFAIENSIASREDMLKVQRMTAQATRTAQSPDNIATCFLALDRIPPNP